LERSSSLRLFLRLARDEDEDFIVLGNKGLAASSSSFTSTIDFLSSDMAFDFLVLAGVPFVKFSNDYTLLGAKVVFLVKPDPLV
jgi:hypothetical protein